MRITVTMDDDLLARATELTDIADTSELVREGLTALVQREAARRLALLGGSELNLKRIPRRRSKPGRQA